MTVTMTMAHGLSVRRRSLTTLSTWRIRSAIGTAAGGSVHTRRIHQAPPWTHKSRTSVRQYVRNCNAFISPSVRENTVEHTPRSSAIEAGTAKKRDQRTTKISKRINKKLLELGKQRNWNALLAAYERHHEVFDAINYSTLLRQLLFSKLSFDKDQPNHDSDPRLSGLLQNLLDRVNTQGLSWLTCRGAASILHALAKMRMHHHDNQHCRECTRHLFQFLTQPEIAAQFIAQANSFDIANVAYSCALIQFPAPYFFQQIELHADRWTDSSGNNNNANAQDVSNTLWAFATLGHQPPHNILKMVERRANQLIQTGSSQAIVNTAWSCATLNVPMPRYFQTLDQNIETALRGATPQAVANAAWSCATLGHSCTQLFRALNRDAVWLVSEGTHQAVAMAAWSCAVLGHAAPQLWTAMERNATWLIQEATAPQTVANVVWACSTLWIHHHHHHSNNNNNNDDDNCSSKASPRQHQQQQQPRHIPTRLLHEAEQRAPWLVETGSSQEVAITLAAFATLGCAAPQLVLALQQQSHRLVAQATPREMANLAWSLAVLDVYDDTYDPNDDNNTSNQVSKDVKIATASSSSSQFFDELERHIHVLLEDKTPQHLTKTCYAIAVLGLVHDHKDCLVQLWERALRLLDETTFLDVDDSQSAATATATTSAATSFGNECLHQMFQTYLFARAQGVDLPVTTRFLTQCQQTMQSSRIVSDLSEEVSQLLTEIGFAHDREVVPDETVMLPAGAANMLAIDFACRESKVAVELDGPTHFLKILLPPSDYGHWDLTENGPTRAKRQYLQQLGWMVINISYRGYQQVKREDCAKEWLGETVLRAIDAR